MESLVQKFYPKDKDELFLSIERCLGGLHGQDGQYLALGDLPGLK
jgi:hypothetical protein